MACGKAPLALLAALGCTAGPALPDAERFEPQPSCADPVALAEDEVLSLDTSAGPEGFLDVSCTTHRAPQAVAVYEVEADGPTTLYLSAQTEVTPSNFETVIAVRRGSCDARESEVCLYGSGTLEVTPGERLYVIVTGDEPEDEEIDRGPVGLIATELDSGGGIPIVSSAQVHVVPLEEPGYYLLVVDIAGMDPDANTVGGVVWLYGARGELLLPSPEERFGLEFSPSLFPGITTFSGRLTVTVFGLPEQPREARVALFDEDEQVGPAFGVAVEVGTFVGAGQSCGGTELCGAELECTAGTCEASNALVDACERAMRIAVPTPETTTTSARGTLDLDDDAPDLFLSECESMIERHPNGEVLFSVEVPAGAPVDLIARIDEEMTTDQSYLLWIRNPCEERRATDVWCSEGEGFDPPSVTIQTAPPGTYTVFVSADAFGLDEPARVTVQALLRPVLAAGSACDPEEVENRCADLPCSAQGVCPP
jgi:hypothetical protein